MKINIVNKNGWVGFVIATKIAAFITSKKQCLPPPPPPPPPFYGQPPYFDCLPHFYKAIFSPPSDFSKILTPFLNKGAGGLHYVAGII